MKKTLNRKMTEGFTLIELMVAMTIGLIVVAAVGAVYIGNKNTYRTSQAVSRLQDEARFATMTLQNAIQQAGYYGRLENAVKINGRLGSGSDLDAATLPSEDCRVSWSIDLDQAIEMPDTSSGNPYQSSCLDESEVQDEFVGDTDILAVRRASAQLASGDPDLDPEDAANTGRLYLRTDTRRGEIYVGGSTAPAGYDSDSIEDRVLVSELFYLTPDEFDGDTETVPTLRRKFLSTWGGAASLRSERIARYVEDFQLQLGEDTDGDGSADQFVDPPSANPEQAVSVRIWLLFRSETREQDYTAPTTFTLADHTYTVPAGTENFRRLLVTRTFELRNL